MGGDFIQKTLIAGTYHGDSSMIDFENSLTEHAPSFAANATLSSYFEVTWSASCEPAKAHVRRWILIEWEVSYFTPDEQAHFEDNAKFKVPCAVELRSTLNVLMIGPCFMVNKWSDIAKGCPRNFGSRAARGLLR